jgi:hypothetical protein
MWVLSEF